MKTKGPSYYMLSASQGCVQNLENALIFLAKLDKFISKLRVYSRLGWMTKTHFPFVLSLEIKNEGTDQKCQEVRNHLV